jgi:hypothetical protein
VEKTEYLYIRKPQFLEQIPEQIKFVTSYQLFMPCKIPGRRKADSMRFKSTERTAKKRLVSKDGDIMFEVRNVHERWRFFVDLFTSLIVLKWRWVLLLFCASYVLSWLIFGCLWALLVVAYGPGYCVDQVGNQRF